MHSQRHSRLALEETAPPPGFLYVADFLAPPVAEVLLEAVRKLPFEHDRFRGQPLRRGYAQFGCAYITAGRTLQPAPAMPDFLAALAERALAHCPPGTRFDQCIVTRYAEDAGIGWHVDAPCFGDWITAVSLRASARLQLRRGGGGPVLEAAVRPGSLYVLSGPARWDFQHRVVAVRDERYSVTFRSVRERSAAAEADPGA
jgi:alkylated DNA repair dioxygenase AlkB